MAGAQPTPQPRLHQKTTAQQPSPQPPDFGVEAPEDTKREAYLVTFPRPLQTHAATGERLIAPGSLFKQDVLQKLLDALANPVYTNWWLVRGGGVPVSRAGVWREWHDFSGASRPTQGDVHDHGAVLGEQSFRYLPVKRALLQRHGLASHWSCTHTGHWSTVRYLALPSPSKPFNSLDHYPVLWAKHGFHPAVLDCCYEPVTAKALTAKRQKIVAEATEAGEAEPKVNDLDVWALVVRSGVRNTDDDKRAHLRLGAFAKQHCGEAMVHYLFRRRQQLPKMIDDIWQWENMESLAEQAGKSRIALLNAAGSSACVCNGIWGRTVADSFVQNGINITELCHDVLDALHHGRSETLPVIVFAGQRGGEGKSVFFKPLRSVYDGDNFVFSLTGECGNFPLMDLPYAKVVFLDEFRFDPEVISWATLCLWFDGSAVPLGRPQNVPGESGNMTYKGSAPIFVTTKLPDLESLEYNAQINPVTGEPWDADASMLLRRLKIYKFRVRIQKPPKFKFCARCFAHFLRSQAPTWQPC